MILNYVLPNGKVQVSPVDATGEVWYEEWLQHMVKENPDFNFFYTIATTDIWEDERSLFDPRFEEIYVNFPRKKGSW